MKILQRQIVTNLFKFIKIVKFKFISIKYTLYYKNINYYIL